MGSFLAMWTPIIFFTALLLSTTWFMASQAVPLGDTNPNQSRNPDSESLGLSPQFSGARQPRALTAGGVPLGRISAIEATRTKEIRAERATPRSRLWIFSRGTQNDMDEGNWNGAKGSGELLHNRVQSRRIVLSRQQEEKQREVGQQQEKKEEVGHQQQVREEHPQKQQLTQQVEQRHERRQRLFERRSQVYTLEDNIANALLVSLNATVTFVLSSDLVLTRPMPPIPQVPLGYLRRQGVQLTLIGNCPGRPCIVDGGGKFGFFSSSSPNEPLAASISFVGLHFKDCVGGIVTLGGLSSFVARGCTFTNCSSKHPSLKVSIPLSPPSCGSIVKPSPTFSPLFPSSASFDNCTIRNSWSSGDGGAICVPPSSSLSISRSSFLNCKAAGNGGAILVRSSAVAPSSLSLYSSRFSGNAAGGAGGAIYGEISSNSIIPLGSNSNDVSTGGKFPVAPTTGKLEAFSCRFSSNSAAIGGAIALYSSSETSTSYVQLCQNNFSSNSASKAIDSPSSNDGNSSNLYVSASSSLILSACPGLPPATVVESNGPYDPTSSPSPCSSCSPCASKCGGNGECVLDAKGSSIICRCSKNWSLSSSGSCKSCTPGYAGPQCASCTKGIKGPDSNGVCRPDSSGFCDVINFPPFATPSYLKLLKSSLAGSYRTCRASCIALKNKRSARPTCDAGLFVEARPTSTGDPCAKACVLFSLKTPGIYPPGFDQNVLLSHVINKTTVFYWILK